MKLLRDPIEFQWDKGNLSKNFFSHQVMDSECEEVFFDPQKKILKDRLHSGNEERFILLGKTKEQRILFVVFTIRRNKIRVISARDLNKKERNLL